VAILFFNKKQYPIPYLWRGIFFPIVYMLIIIFVPMGLVAKIFVSILYPVLWAALIANNNDRKLLIGLFK
jgi:hypothetical protein